MSGSVDEESVEATTVQVVAKNGKLVRPDPSDLVVAPVDQAAEIQERIFTRSLEILDGVQDFGSIDPTAEAPPQDWIEKYGEEQAKVRFRHAKYGIMSAKEAPVGIKVAEHIATSIARTKALERTPQRNLNVAILYVEGERKVYPELEVDE